jgi:hypothetical protein
MIRDPNEVREGLETPPPLKAARRKGMYSAALPSIYFVLRPSLAFPVASWALAGLRTSPSAYQCCSQSAEGRVGVPLTRQRSARLR